MVLRRLELDLKTLPRKQLAQLPNQPLAGMMERSYSSLAMISASSASTYSLSGG